MSKAILVIDMPDSCDDCDFCYYSDGRVPCCQLTFNVTDNFKCPLKPLPKHFIDFGGDDDYADGYNDCLNEIIGE